MQSETAERQRTANPRSRNTVTDSLDPKGYQKILQQKHHGPEGVADVLRVLKSKKIPNKNFLSSRVIIQKQRRDFKNFLVNKSYQSSSPLNWPYKKYFRKSFKLKRSGSKK